MATDIILRSVKASALTHAEMDQNLESMAMTVDAKTADYTVLVADQNKLFEINGSSLTLTLPTVSSASGTDTDSFKIYATNIHSTPLTIDGNGAETIDGAATFILNQYETCAISLNSGATSWSVIHFSEYDRKGADIASAATTDIGAATGQFVDVTGTTTITGLGTARAGIRRTVQFDGALTLTHNSTSLRLPGDANIAAAAGDVAEFISLGSGNWICTNYQQDAPTIEGFSGIGVNDSTFYVGTGTTIANESASTARTSLGLGGLATLNSVGSAQIDDNTVRADEIAAITITQAEMADNSIGQNQLRDSTAAGSQDITASAAETYVLTGATFAWWTISAENTSSEGAMGWGNGNVAAGSLGVHNGHTADRFIYVDERYITSSGPYDWGYGEAGLIQQFLVNSDGSIHSSRLAHDPMWAYNGPTDFSKSYCKKDKLEKYTKVRLYKTEKIDVSAELKHVNLSRREKMLERISSDPFVEIKVTQAIKNADMLVWPHPFINQNLTGKTVVTVDPVSDFSHKLFVMQKEVPEESVRDLYLNKYLTFDNTSLVRGLPMQVVQGKWKNTK